MNRQLCGPRAIAVFAALTLAAPTVTTNAVQLDFDHGRVTITRDEYGAPHVVGSSLEAVWFGVGYAQAQDRLWQAETLRRAATGTSAEIQGASAVEADVMARTVFGPPSRRADAFQKRLAGDEGHPHLLRVRHKRMDRRSDGDRAVAA